jgi:hypothetical protein
MFDCQASGKSRTDLKPIAGYCASDFRNNIWGKRPDPSGRTGEYPEKRQVAGKRGM